MSHLLEQIRNNLDTKNLSGILIPHDDMYFGEYLVKQDETIAWLTDFTGSAGFLIITKDTAALFVDGRYTLQAKNQVDTTKFSLHTLGEETSWLKHQLHDHTSHVMAYDHTSHVMAYDPTCFSKSTFAPFEALDVKLTPLPHALMDLWEERPFHPRTPLTLHDEKYSGQTAVEKIQNVREKMASKKVEATLLPPESWHWMLNVRGADLFYTPVSQGFCFITSAEIFLFLHTLDQNEEVSALFQELQLKIFSCDDMPELLAQYKDKKFGYDPDTTPLTFLNIFAQSMPFKDPCILPKSTKNKVEIPGMIQAHIQDALAWVYFWQELEERLAQGHPLKETDIDRMLLTHREDRMDFVCPSFATIAGSGPNGAIVHYRAEEKTARTLGHDELLLIDSGGHYKTGTTDITRTLIIGEPSKDMITDFTHVLKGHIALASVTFPLGTTGAQLDALARAPLWSAHKDYAHGTGHGVGSFLSVHEGPCRISKAGHHPLLPGMVLSNEPGYYKENAYGIRIENLMFVKEISPGWCGFETLTLVPLENKLVDKDALTREEKSWLNQYHTKILGTLAPHLDTKFQGWLREKTQCFF